MTLINKAEALAAVEAWFAETRSFAPPSLVDAIASLPARGVGVPTERPNAPAHIVEYTNWRGETARRTIIPIRMWWGSTEWHPEEQWMLTAWDVEKDAARDFAWQDMRPVQNGATSAAVAAQRAALTPTTAADPGDDVSPSASDPVTTPPTGAAAAAVAPTDAAHVNEAPKSEHDAGNMLTDYILAPHLQKIVEGAKTAPQWDMQADRLAPTDAAQAREAAARLLLDMLNMRNGAHEGVSKKDVQKMWDAAGGRHGFAAVDAFLRSIIKEART